MRHGRGPGGHHGHHRGHRPPPMHHHGRHYYRRGGCMGCLMPVLLAAGMVAGVVWLLF